MAKFLKYLGIVCLTVVLTMVALAAMVLYQSFERMANYLDGVDFYTCGQFMDDLQMQDKTSQGYPMLVATLAYGKGAGEKGLAAAIDAEGFVPAVSKVIAACDGHRDARVLTVLMKDAATMAGVDISATAPVSATVVSATEPVSQTAVSPAAPVLSSPKLVSETAKTHAK
jgi:hypothetical protein